jgi:glycosyltransferase involved in cell wall biosynthesis
VRIAFFTEGYDPFINGVVHTIQTWRTELKARGHEVTVFAPRYPGYRDTDPGVVRLPSVKWSRIHYPVRAPFARGGAIAAREFDLVHSHHPFTMARLAVRVARSRGLPLVYTFHTLLSEYAHYVPLSRSVGRLWLRHAYLRHCAEADRITTPTGTVRDVLRGEGVATPMHVVSAGVPAVTAAPGARERVRCELGVPTDVPLLLYTGRLVREKGLDFLLRSLAPLCRSSDARLCLAGGGHCEIPLRRIADQLGIGERVLFPGWIPHARIADLYAAADLFVFPSTTDTMGVVLVEAMMQGLPCVAVDRYGPGEIVSDGETGLLVPSDERAFADAVNRLLCDPLLRTQMGEAGKAKSREYAPAAVTRRLLAVYEEALRS